jgi:hypothetical protein
MVCDCPLEMEHFWIYFTKWIYHQAAGMDLVPSVSKATLRSFKNAAILFPWSKVFT